MISRTRWPVSFWLSTVTETPPTGWIGIGIVGERFVVSTVNAIGCDQAEKDVPSFARALQ